MHLKVCIIFRMIRHYIALFPVCTHWLYINTSYNSKQSQLSLYNLQFIVHKFICAQTSQQWVLVASCLICKLVDGRRRDRWILSLIMSHKHPQDQQRGNLFFPRTSDWNTTPVLKHTEVVVNLCWWAVIVPLIDDLLVILLWMYNSAEDD